MAKLTILCYDQIPTSLQSNGLAAIPKVFQLLNLFSAITGNVNIAWLFGLVSIPSSSSSPSPSPWALAVT